MAVGIQVTFDAADPQALAAFWAETLGYVEQVPPEGFGSWETWAEANDIPREDWDKYDARVAAAVERAVAAGATKVHEVDELGEHWVVLQDPEGNEFCMH